MNIHCKHNKQLSVLFIFISSFLFNSLAMAMDSQTKNALYDINKYEKQFSGSQTYNKLTIKRTLRLLKLTGQKLNSSKQKNSPEWKQANSRYRSLVSRLNSAIQPKQNRAAASNKPKKPQKAQQRTATAAASTQMISQQRTRVKKLKRDIESTIQTLDKGGIKPFQDPNYVNKFKKRYSHYQQSLSKYNPFRSDADVVAASQSLQAMSNMMAFGKKEAIKASQGTGDAQAILKQADAAMRSMKLPRSPKIPPKEGELVGWIKQLASIRKKAIAALKPLPNLKRSAHLPNNPGTVSSGAPYDMNDLNRIDRGIRGVVSKIDGSLKTMNSNLNANVKMALINLEDGRGDLIKNDYAVVSAAATLSKILNKKDEYAGHIALMKKLENASASFMQANQNAIQDKRVPKAISNDAKLISIARKTMAASDEKIGNIKRLVITKKMEHRSEDRSQEKYDSAEISLGGDLTIKGTRTTYHYVWDEFGAYTVEPLNGKFYLFYNKFKYYTSGASILNQWVLATRIQGDQILEVNINK